MRKQSAKKMSQNKLGKNPHKDEVTIRILKPEQDLPIKIHFWKINFLEGKLRKKGKNHIFVLLLPQLKLASNSIHCKCFPSAVFCCFSRCCFCSCSVACYCSFQSLFPSCLLIAALTLLLLLCNEAQRQVFLIC